MAAGDCEPGHPPIPGERPMMTLGQEELFVVAALRAWVTPLRAPGEPCPDWRTFFRMAAIPGGGEACFDRMMSMVARCARRLLDVRCCHCTSLGADEAALLALVVALQDGEALHALDLLTEWMPAEAAAAAFPHAWRFAALTAQGGLRLPASARSGGPPTTDSLPDGAGPH